MTEGSCFNFSSEIHKKEKGVIKITPFLYQI